MLTPQHRVAILMHDGIKTGRGKTGISLLRYGQMPVVAVIDHQTAGQSLADWTGIQNPAPIVASVNDALAYEPDVLAIGIAPSGGSLPEPLRQEVRAALAAGLSVVNGLHTSLADDPELRSLVTPPQWIWDVRREPEGLSVGSGRARSLPSRRILAVGTDMAVGKMSTGIELHQAALSTGLRSAFVATGQTGLMLGYGGVALDAVRIDFASGAVEQAVLAQGQDCDLVWIEGQGSFFNPASTATLPLLRGSQPTHLVLVHRAGLTHIHNLPQILIPPLSRVVQIYEAVAAAGGAFTAPKIVAVALNTFGLTESDARQAIADVQDETQLPCTDVIRFGSAPILDAILATDPAR
ncbi:DUF1611 domain-containing protein [Leptolyngbya sp. CCY15150]|uniref:DUF1611 domain-containing protein n=1 Tax=Leptolyngbya sp. CCY15150 TaxID=2767772 RepID=UPI001950FB96|nr:DUF1611 domain-containing protein [Leptolyngbya sp. CCY15150]